MSSLSFTFSSKSVRVAGTIDHPLFVAKDVCDVLEIGTHRDAVARLPDSCKGRSVVVDSLGGPQEMTTLTEAGVYRLIFKSRKPQAEEFQRWVTEDVLPSIRRSGRYQLAHKPLPPPIRLVSLNEVLGRRGTDTLPFATRQRLEARIKREYEELTGNSPAELTGSESSGFFQYLYPEATLRWILEIVDRDYFPVLADWKERRGIPPACVLTLPR